jgi:hypothetical protein
MPSNDSNEATNTAASGRRTKWGVTPPVGTPTGVETPHNNPNCPSTRASKNLMISGDATTTKVTTTMHHKNATPAIQNPATVDGTKDEETPTMMQLKGPPVVKTQQNATTEVTQTLSQLNDPPVFETWQHGTPDAALTLSKILQRLKCCSMPLHHPQHPSFRTMMTITLV